MKLLICADFVACNRVLPFVEKYDSASVFDDISALIAEADYSIVNFEAPVCEGQLTPITKSGPNLSAPLSSLQMIKVAGFDCVTLANNHFFDQGQNGVEQTICACKELKLDYVGGGVTIDESVKTLYITFDNHTVAIINACEEEFSIATKTHGGSNPIRVIDICHQIKEARQKASKVILILHGGIEMYQLPTSRMQKEYRYYIEQGADVVINHHQHCFSGYERYMDKTIFYGLGNFCFDKNQKSPLWTKGYCVMLNIDEEITFRLYPYIQCADKPHVCLMNDKEVPFFVNRIKELNDIIACSEKLDLAFAEYISSVRLGREASFEPVTNKWVQRLQRRKLFPRLFKNGYKHHIIGTIKCAAHRDVFEKLYEL